MKSKVLSLLKFVASLLLGIILWVLANHCSGINTTLLPTPFQVAIALRDMIRDDHLLLDTIWSVGRAAAGFVCGGFLGVLVGTLTSRTKSLNWLLSPLFNGLRSIPPVAIVPLIVVWVGLGETGKVFITSWASFFPVWLNTHEGVSSVDKQIIWSSKSLGAKGVRLLLEVMIPAALPRILVGFRLAISTTLICVIVAEMTGAYFGLGYKLQISYLVFRVDRMLACLMILAIIGIACDLLFVRITNRLFPWIKLRHDLR